MPAISGKLILADIEKIPFSLPGNYEVTDLFGATLTRGNAGCCRSELLQLARSKVGDTAFSFTIYPEAS